jgi:RNA-binding protein
MAALELSGFHRTYLRGLAHALKPTVQVGKDGVTDAVHAQVDAALLDHELVKVRLIRPPDKKAVAAELAERAGAALCGLVGHTVILYRPHPEKPRLELPQR